MRFTEYEPREDSYREGRISYAEANAHLYGGAIGTTAYSTEITHYTSDHEVTLGTIERLTGNPDVSDLAIDEVDAALRQAFDKDGWTWKDEDIAASNEADDRLLFLRRASDVIEATQGASGSDDPREAFVASVIQDVLADNELEQYYADSSPLSLTVSIVERYANRLQETVMADDWPAFLNTHRQTFIQAMNTPKLQQLVGKEARQRMAFIAEQTPITIADPLSALIHRPDNGGETLGTFYPHSRTVSIDPFTIRQMVEQDLGDAPPELKLQASHLYLTHTLFHELIHAATNEDYIRYEFDDPTEKKVAVNHRLWPSFWREGWTEKLSHAAFAEIATAEGLPRTGKNEELWRRAYSYEPAEVATTGKSLDLRKHIASSYETNRLLIDTIFQKLDWPAAGITWRQAEKLAAQAFTEVPKPDAAGAGTSARLAFIEAVNKAAHPGFFMKLGTLADLVGVQLVSDIVINPSFDPHDPSAIPYIASTAQAHKYPSAPAAKYGVEDFTKRLADLQEMGAPASVVTSIAHILERKKSELRQSESFALARKGLKTVLEQNHPARRRVPTPQLRLLAALSMEITPGFVDRPRVDTAPHEAAIDAWVAAQRTLSGRQPSGKS